MKSVFNRDKVDFTKEPMFFGAQPNTQRYDVFKYPVFDKLTQAQLGYFWRPEEVSLQKDRADYQQFRPEQKFIFTANLKYQTLLDSVQGRGVLTAFGPYCSLPELESCMNAWQFFENIHSRSYTHIIKNVYSNPSEVFDTILDDEKIIDRAKSVTQAYDDFIDYANRFSVTGEGTMRELKKMLYMAMINVNALEGIRFFVSFACSFAFGELKLMEGSAKIIGLISRDEAQHLAISQHIIKNWQKGDDPEMISIMEECKDDVIAVYKKVVQEEKDWADYLFKDGSIIGLNERLLHEYVEYIANRRVRAIGLDNIFTRHSDNHLPWTQHWLSSKGLQVAPQETEVESYVIGGIKQDVNLTDFSNFKL